MRRMVRVASRTPSPRHRCAHCTRIFFTAIVIFFAIKFIKFRGKGQPARPRMPPRTRRKAIKISINETNDEIEAEKKRSGKGSTVTVHQDDVAPLMAPVKVRTPPRPSAIRRFARTAFLREPRSFQHTPSRGR